MPRRIQQIDLAIAVLELHHRAGHGDAALLLDAHPVARGVALGLPGLHSPGHIDRPSEEEQLLGQRGLPRVGVADDGERAPALDLPKQRRFRCGNFAADRHVSCISPS